MEGDEVRVQLKISNVGKSQRLSKSLKDFTWKSSISAFFITIRVTDDVYFQLKFEAKLDGKSFAKITNPRPLKFSNVKLYAEHHLTSASVVINKLKYKTKVEGEVEDAKDSSGIKEMETINTLI